MVQEIRYLFLLDGTDVTDYIIPTDTKIEMTRKDAGDDTAEIHISKTVDDVMQPQTGLSIVISRGVASTTEQYVFRGTVKVLQEEDDRYIVKCKNPLHQLKYDIFTKSYDRNIDTEAGELSAIADDILTEGGLTTSVESSGTGDGDITVDKFISRRQSRKDRLSIITRILNWTLRYDYDNDRARLEPKGFTVYGKTLTVGTNIYNIPQWEQDLEVMRNRITVEGAIEYDVRTETFNASAAQTDFNLANAADDTKVTVDGTLQTRGVTGSTTGFDYVYDSTFNRIEFVSGLSGGESVVIEYTSPIPVPVTGTSEESIGTYRITQEESYTFDDVVTVDDAETRVKQLLQLLKDGAVSTQLLVDEYDIRPGYKVPVVDPGRPRFDDEYIVQSVIITYGEPYDMVKIGSERFSVNELFQTIQERINQLEGNFNVLGEILRRVFDLFSETVTENRYLTTQKADLTNASVYGKVTYNQVVYQNSESNMAEYAHQPGNNTFREFAYDDEFYDSANSTDVTWNTSNKQITISATTGVLLTKRIALKDTYTAITLALQGGTGATIEVSADGKSTWQTVTQYNKATFSSADGTGIYIRISNTTASDITLAPIYKINGRFDQPAILATLE